MATGTRFPTRARLLVVGVGAALSPLLLATQPARRMAAPQLSDAQAIHDALLPLPKSLRAHATVVGRGADGRYVRLRPGDNGLVCETQDPAVETMRLFCYQESMRPLRERRQALIAGGHSAAEATEMLDAEVARGAFTAPNAATAYLLRGPRGCLTPGSDSLCAEASLVYMLYTPGMTTKTLGLPAAREGRVPYMHAEGTVWAHVMVEPPLVSAPDSAGGKPSSDVATGRRPTRAP